MEIRNLIRKRVLKTINKSKLAISNHMPRVYSYPPWLIWPLEAMRTRKHSRGRTRGSTALKGSFSTAFMSCRPKYKTLASEAEKVLNICSIKTSRRHRVWCKHCSLWDNSELAIQIVLRQLISTNGIPNSTRIIEAYEIADKWLDQKLFKLIVKFLRIFLGAHFWEDWYRRDCLHLPQYVLY